MNLIKEISAEKRALLYSFGFAMLVVLSSADMKLAVFFGTASTAALTLATLIVTLLKKYTKELGLFIVQISVICLVLAVFSAAASAYFPEITESFIFLSAIIPVSGFSFLVFPKNERIGFSAFRTFTSGIILLLSSALVALIRDLLGKGTVFGIRVFENTAPIFSELSGGFILAGVLFAAANAVFHRIYLKKSKIMQKNEINTEADDADN